MRRPLALASAALLAMPLLPPIGSWLAEPVALGGALLAILAAALRLSPAPRLALDLVGIAGLVCGAAATLLLLTPDRGTGGAAFGLWAFFAGLLLLAWQMLQSLSTAAGGRLGALLVPALFGLCLLYAWEVVVTGLGVSRILLPPPSLIGHALVSQAATLWNDFKHTFLVSTLAGFVLGCGAGFVAAALTDRVPFLQRGLLPLGNLVSAVPIVGIAPVMVMWFGFGWESKAAVIVVMTFFPMLINAIAGLAATDHIQRDLMRSWGAGYWQTFFKLRLPAALPFIFNALKINSTLALIGAIVAEMFGSPIYGMGFRISTEVYKMNADIAWATIAVAALAGSLFYGLIALLERGLTFWHPSYRR